MNFTYLQFNKPIYLHDLNQKGYLYARGFINKSVLFYQTNKKSTSSEFIILPKILNDKDEDNDNKQNNGFVSFGTEIRIKHIQSGYFIVGSGEPLENFNGLKLQMIQKPQNNNNCIFKILPLRTFEHEGDLISDKSPFIIQNEKHRCFLNVNQLIQNRLEKYHILNQKEKLKSCKISLQKSSKWTFIQKSKQHHQYLHQNYQDNSILSVDKKDQSIQYKLRDYNDYQIYKALWEVQFIQREDQNKHIKQELTLKHVVSGKYFNRILSETPTTIQLKPLLQTDHNLPPFEIHIVKNNNRTLYKRNDQSQNEHGFLISKIDKKEINQILSICGMKPKTWIPYLNIYLNKNNDLKKSILREFKIIEILIDIIRQKKYENLQECYNLLYKICQGNSINKKICSSTENLHLLLVEPNKKLIQELIIELLNDNCDDIIQKEITHQIILAFIKEYKDYRRIEYLKILRTFCGNNKKINERNQKIIFNYFFGNSGNFNLEKSAVYEIKEEYKLENQFKFKIVKKEDQIFFQLFRDGAYQLILIQNIDKDTREYCRQYLYLLGDCLKNRNQNNAEFRLQFPLLILSQMLHKKQFEEFKGPILYLIESGYINYHPYQKKQYLLLNSSEFSFKGNLISLIKEDDQKEILFQVLEFIKAEIQIEPSYCHSYILILLQTLKLTIEFRFWKNMKDLLEIKQQLQKIIFKDEHQIERIKEHYESQLIEYINQSKIIKEKKNSPLLLINSKILVRSKIIAVEIYNLIIDLQLNIWVSQFIAAKQQTEDNITIEKWFSQKKNIEWKLDLGFFKLSSIKNSELMKSSLQLFYRIFNIKKQLYDLLRQIRIQENEMKQDLTNSLLKMRMQNFSKKQTKIQNFLKLLNVEIDFPAINQILFYLFENYEENYVDRQSLKLVNDRYITLFKYKRTNRFFQNLAIKSGFHKIIIEEIFKYSVDFLKQKYTIKIFLYFCVLIGIIKDNPINKKVLSKYRKQLIKFLGVRNLVGIIAQFIEQLYKNNKSLNSDYKQIEYICQQILKCVLSKHIQTNYILKSRLINLLNLFLSDKLMIDRNQCIIINQIFKKEYVAIIDINKNVYYQIIIYDIMTKLNLKHIKNKFANPKNFRDLQILLRQKDWDFKSKIRFYINQNQQLYDTKQIISLFEDCVDDLNYILYEISRQREKKLSQLETYEYQKNLRELIQFYRKISIKLRDSSSKQSERQKINNLKIQTRQIRFKIYERLYLLKNCNSSQQLSNQIQYILKTIIPKIQPNCIIEGKQYPYDLIERQLDQIQKNQIYQLEFRQNLKNILITPKLLDDSLITSTKHPLKMSRKTSIKQNRVFNQIYNHICALKANKLNKNYKINYAYSGIEQRIDKQFIINIIDINKRDSTILSDQIKLFIVRLLTGSMLNKSNFNTQQQYLYAEFTRQQIKDLSNYQKKYEDFDIPELICTFLQESFQQRFELFNGIFQLAISLIIGGNTHYQNKFMEVFVNDKKNTVFTNLSIIIEQCTKNIEFFYKSKQISSDQKFNSFPTVQRSQFSLDSTEIEMYRQQRKYSCNLLWKLFRFLQLLCQNNNSQMKQYIINQVDNNKIIKYTSINFIDEANKTFSTIISILKSNFEQLKILDSYFIKEDDFNIKQCFYIPFKAQIEQNLCLIPVIIFDFLIEVCQILNQKNQQYICRTNFFQNILNIQNMVHSLNQDVVINYTDLINVKQPKGTLYKNQKLFFFVILKKLIILIRSLLESGESQIINILRKSISEKLFIFLIEESFHFWRLDQKSNELNQFLNRGQMKSQLLNITSILIIKRILYKDLQKQVDAMMPTLEEKIRSIEIYINSSNKNLTVYFTYHPLFDGLSSRTKDQLLYASTQSRNEKLKKILYSRQLIYEEIEFESQNHKKLINQKKLHHLFNLCLAISCIIICLLGMFYSIAGLRLKMDIIQQKIIFILSQIQFMLTLIYFILWGFHQSPLVQKRMNKQRQKQKKKQMQNKIKRSLKIQQNKLQAQNKQSLIDLIRYKIQLIKRIYLYGDDSLPTLFFFIIAFIAIIFQYRWYSFHIFFLFIRLNVLSNIFEAITTNAYQMILVCLFAITFTFVFAFITLNSYLIPLYENQQIDIDISKNGEHCTTILSCIVSLYTQHVIGQGTPGENLNEHYQRFVYDIIFLSFFGIFFNNIISGIMIDKFAQLRDTRQKIQNQNKNKCYICSADKSEIEKNKEIFEEHIKKTHNLWNYFFYMYTLQKIKNSNDFTGIQYMIEQKIEKYDIDWFPFESRMQQNLLNDKIEELSKKLNELKLNQVINK